jgi:hypothetical protein
MMIYIRNIRLSYQSEFCIVAERENKGPTE